MSPGKRRGPGRETEATDTARSQSHSSPVDLTTLSGDEFDAFTLGYTWGYVAGIARGRQLADDEAATLHREAVRVVRALAKIDPRDPEADQAAHSRRESRWSA